MKKKRYVLWNKENRVGEFEFCCETQEYWSSSLKRVKEELADIAEETGNDSKDYIIYELILKRIKE